MAAQYGGQYGGQRLPGPGGQIPGHPSHAMGGAPGPMPSQQALAYRRPSPYPQNAALMQRKQYAASGMPVSAPCTKCLLAFHS